MTNNKNKKKGKLIAKELLLFGFEVNTYHIFGKESILTGFPSVFDISVSLQVMFLFLSICSCFLALRKIKKGKRSKKEEKLDKAKY